MGRTPDFFEDLRRVGALKKGLLDGQLSDNALSKIPLPPVFRDTVGAWLRGERFPQRPEPLSAVDILAEPSWAGLLGPADRRGLTPLFWSHERPYGEVRLDLGSRLAIGPAVAGRWL